MAIDNDNGRATNYLIEHYFGTDQQLATFTAYTPYLSAWSETINQKKALHRFNESSPSFMTALTRKHLDRQADYEVYVEWSVDHGISKSCERLLQQLHYELFDKYSRKETRSSGTTIKELIIFCLFNNKLNCVKALSEVKIHITN